MGGLALNYACELLQAMMPALLDAQTKPPPQTNHIFSYTFITSLDYNTDSFHSTSLLAEHRDPFLEAQLPELIASERLDDLIRILDLLVMACLAHVSAQLAAFSETKTLPARPMR